MRELRIEMGFPLSSSTTVVATLMVHPEETQDEKVQDPGPQRAEVHTKGMISVSPDSWHFPTKKSTKLFNLRYLVFFK